MAESSRLLMLHPRCSGAKAVLGSSAKMAGSPDAEPSGHIRRCRIPAAAEEFSPAPETVILGMGVLIFRF
ncbi:hypothetical protein D7X33_03360 [Butyricicoccus sp. 1XD8-22]|nr:hypothetical protein D7X33_03360 [Butyricicoccus sp. 1XD8-22]